MKPCSAKSRNVQRGLSLVELMIGVTIALIAILVMEQTVVFFNEQKRGTTGGADAQNTGMIAMYSLESDLRHSGYGLATLDTLYCTMSSSAANRDGLPFIPVMIIPDGMAAGNALNVLGIPPGDAGSDILVTMYSNTQTVTEGVPIVATPGTGGLEYQFANNATGFAVDDYILAAQSGRPCTIAQIDAVDPTNFRITVDHSFGTASYTASTARVFNLGSAGMTMHIYAIRGGKLTMCDAWANDCSADLSSMSTAQVNALWAPIASNIVGLRAQYGWDTNSTADMYVDAYCRSRLTPSSAMCPTPDAGATLPNSSCDWTRIATLRVALVARNAEMASGGVNASDATLDLWPDSTTSPTTIGPTFSVPSQKYRYKVFQSTTPIRNVIWLGAQSSCT